MTVPSISSDAIHASIRNSLRWFRQSGVMSPADGSWGIAERIVLTPGNTALGKIQDSFPAFTCRNEHMIVNMRRADCNFQLAFLADLAHAVTGDPEDARLRDNLLCFLFERSGLRAPLDSGWAVGAPKGAWKWSHIDWQPRVWLDDNSWVSALSLALSRSAPEAASRYNLRQAGLDIADGFAEHMDAILRNKNVGYMGVADRPHWTALVAMALACAFSETGDRKYRDAASRCLDFLRERDAGFNCSELAYMLLGTITAAEAWRDEALRAYARALGGRLVDRMTEAGTFPSEHNSEAPAGRDLADLIYTQNWALLALQMLAETTGDKTFVDAYRRTLDFVVRIQDTTTVPHLLGCWRGMYDCAAGDWGGGDCYEGGAGSIYTGWTNAPIGWALAFALQGKSLASHLTKWTGTKEA